MTAERGKSANKINSNSSKMHVVNYRVTTQRMIRNV